MSHSIPWLSWLKTSQQCTFGYSFHSVKFQQKTVCCSIRVDLFSKQSLKTNDIKRLLPCFQRTISFVVTEALFGWVAGLESTGCARWMKVVIEVIRWTSGDSVYQLRRLCHRRVKAISPSLHADKNLICHWVRKSLLILDCYWTHKFLTNPCKVLDEKKPKLSASKVPVSFFNYIYTMWNITSLKDLVESLKQQKLVSDAEQHLLEQNFDGVGKYLFENQIANAKQASKQAICHGCGLWAGNTHTYFCANWWRSPVCVCIGSLRWFGSGMVTEHYFTWDGHALTSPKGGRPCSLGTLNYVVVGHLAYQ